MSSREVISAERSDIEWLLTVYSRNWKPALLSCMLVIARALLLLCPAVMNRSIINALTLSPNPAILRLSAGALVAIPIITGSLILIDLRVSSFALRAGAEWRARLYDDLQRKPLAWIEQESIGDLVSRIHSEAEKVFLFAYQGLGSLVWFTSTVVVGVGIVFWLNAVMGSLTTIVLMTQWALTTRLGKRVTLSSTAIAENQAALAEMARETITGALSIKAMGKEEPQSRRFASQAQAYRREWLRHLALERKSDLIRSLASCVIPPLIYGTGVVLMPLGRISIGSALAAVAVYSWVQPAISGLQTVYLQWKRLMGNIQRIRQYHDGSETRSRTLGLFPSVTPFICVDNASLAIGSRQVLDGVSLEIPFGSTTAIVGASGSGKSTLVDALSGIRPLDSGAITIGGILVQDIDSLWLSKNVAVVLQDSHVRNETIRENIAYGLDSLTDEDLKESARAACLAEWIETLDNGLNTRIGEQGQAISGGERQRVCIARALTRSPQILILDEATSALDYATSRRVLANIRDRLPSSTLLCVTHRVREVMEADTIWVMDNGCIVQRGSHDALMSIPGPYQRMFVRQQEGELHGRP